MKYWQCPSCARRRDSSNDIIIKVCGCGEFMLEDIIKKEGFKNVVKNN